MFTGTVRENHDRTCVPRMRAPEMVRCLTGGVGIITSIPEYSLVNVTAVGKEPPSKFFVGSHYKDTCKAIRGKGESY